jgi:hypothetical protein
VQQINGPLEASGLTSRQEILDESSKELDVKKLVIAALFAACFALPGGAPAAAQAPGAVRSHSSRMSIEARHHGRHRRHRRPVRHIRRPVRGHRRHHR